MIVVIWLTAYAYTERKSRTKEGALTSLPLHYGRGGNGGSGRIVNGTGLIIGGRGGAGGPGGNGGDGGGGEITGGHGMIVGGDGGSAGDAEGNGGRGDDSGYARAVALGLVSPHVIRAVEEAHISVPVRDKTLTEGALYAVLGRWGLAGGIGNFEPDPSVPRTAGNLIVDWLPEFEQKARDGVVTVWGRSHENSTAPLAEVPPEHWQDYTVDFLATVMGEARSRRRIGLSHEGAFDKLMVCSGEFGREWPGA